MVNWIRKLQAENASLKKENASLRKVSKGKGQDSSRTVIKLKHKIRSLKESLGEYRKLVEKFSEENSSLKGGTEAAEDAAREKVRIAQLRLKKAIRVVHLLDLYLRHLPVHVVARFKDDLLFEKYVDFMRRFVLPFREKLGRPRRMNHDTEEGRG